MPNANSESPINRPNVRAATANDWPDLKPMSRRHKRLPLNLRFDASQMRNLRLGDIPVDQDQKWFLYFENDTLHLHRSWTGFKMFEVVFETDGDGGLARFARINLDAKYYSGTLEEARETLVDVLQYYATDEAHELYEPGIVTALKEALKPNYLGKPAVVFELLGNLFQLSVANVFCLYTSDFAKTTYDDVLNANRRVCAVLCGQIPDYHGLEEWRTENCLGKAVIDALDLDKNYYADENLNCILANGLSGVSLQIREIIRAWIREGASDTEGLGRLLRKLQSFVTSVLMGTHEVLYPGVKLTDFTWKGSEFLVAMTDEMEDGEVCIREDDEEAGEDENLSTAPTASHNASFEELLRALREVDEAEAAGDAPEDREEKHDALPPGPPVHPRLDDSGHLVKLKAPSTPTPQWTWQDAGSTAIVIPNGPMPQELSGIGFRSWIDAPKDNAGWELLAGQNLIEEPVFKLAKGMKPAAGVVVLEEDGRVWAVAPSNAFGGYPASFAKGTCESGMSLQATALREAFEESGLQVRLTGHLVDIQRSTSYTRYYLARRIGGNPADMGWESQAAMLVPVAHLSVMLTNKNDQPILKALIALASL